VDAAAAVDPTTLDGCGAGVADAPEALTGAGGAAAAERVDCVVDGTGATGLATLAAAAVPAGLTDTAGPLFVGRLVDCVG